jgi:uncharacterized OB-fold protein
MTDRPLPVPDSDSRPYWEAAARHEFQLPYCVPCQRYFFIPRVLCPHCRSEQVEWRRASGNGVIYSYTVSRRPAGPAFADRVPYVVALIDLEEGPRMMSNVVTDDADAVRIGQRVRVEFEDAGELSLPVFRIVNE